MNNQKMTHIAIDLGATSGRVILYTQDKSLELIHRFKHNIIEKSTLLYWDIQNIFNEIIIGLKKVHRLGIIPNSLGIDTWAVDYALLDEDGTLIEGIRSYRSTIPTDVIESSHTLISQEKLYALL